MIREDEGASGLSYWPSVSDLFMTLFIVAIALVGSVLFVLLPAPVEDSVVQAIRSQAETIARLQDQVRTLGSELEAERQASEHLERELAEREEVIEALKERYADGMDARGMDEPPIIVIKKADSFFALGSAALTPEFEAYLGAAKGAFQQIAKEIRERNRNDLTRVDTLEIIGHTDGIPLASRGNLDTALPDFLRGAHEDLARLKPGSNNDLGLLRALAVKQAWGRFIAGHPGRSALAAIAVRTYSAGQTLPVEPGRFAREDEQARRIELRLTKLERGRPKSRLGFID